MIDIHSHILPGVDDGAKDMKTALEMARIAVGDGIKKMIATPHLFRGSYSIGGLSQIKKAKQKFIQALKENDIPLEILSGAEVHISHNLIDEIKAHRSSLALNQSRYMFIEFPSDHVFSGVKDLVFELMTEGTVPIIAHPERNSVFRRNPNFLYELVQMGVLTQVNQGSFNGIYGGRAQEAVFRFLELGYVHFLATDCHNTWVILPKLSGALRKAEEVIGEENARALVWDNPLSVVEDKELTYLPEPREAEAKKKTFKIKLPSFMKKK
ncbi:MAG: CpsB/CapC family capsule biosynthesis tyrosine phosphatase [Candidatus Aminicenantes bacterium]